MPSPQEHRWPCAQCGADLRFAPGQTELRCDHCGHVQSIPAANTRSRSRALGEIDLERGLRNDLSQAEMVEVRTSTCTNCGAHIEFDGATHATQCPFCASPIVTDTGAERHIKPQAVIPFTLTEDQARQSLVTWMGSLWFAPNGLLEYARKGRAMSGMYVPFWTYDADTASRYTGQRGEYYYETRTVSVVVNGKREQRQEQVRHTRWYPASGQVSRQFDDVLVMASNSLPRRLGDELTPWDLSALEPYTPDYLAGFSAEGYTVGLADGHAIARENMGRVITSDVARDIGGDEQRIDNISTRYSDETFKHILLPIWVAAYKYRNKTYRFLVNGQTAEVQGERPWSAWKIAFAVVLGLIIAGGVAYYVQLTQQQQ